MNTYVDILGNLPDSDKEIVQKFVFGISNELGRNIMRKLASPHSPISAGDLPVKELGRFSKIATLNQLHQFESLGLVESKMIKRNNRYHRIYDLTTYGQQTAKEYGFI